jgi:hypothetical protein
VGEAVSGETARDPELEAALTPLLSAAGAALVDCQRLEYELGLLLLYLGRCGVRGVSVNRMRAVLDGQEKLTAGQLVRLLGQKTDVAPELAGGLADGLESRNTLIHGFLLRNFVRALDPTTRDDVLAELRGLRARVQAAEHAIRPLVSRLSADLDGVTVEQMQELALRVFHGRQANPWGRPTTG